MQSPQHPNSPFADVMEDVTQNCDGIFHQALNNYTVVDERIQGSTEGEHGGPPSPLLLLLLSSSSSRGRALRKESSEDDKGLVNFLKTVCTLAVAVILFNLATFARVFYSTVYPATNKLQECILAGLAALLPFSVITVGVVHSVEGGANAIDLATTMVIADITYGFFAFCLGAMFIAKAPWFTVVPFFLVAWSVLTGWLLWRYRRPRGIYVMLKKIFKFKMHGQ